MCRVFGCGSRETLRLIESDSTWKRNARSRGGYAYSPCGLLRRRRIADVEPQFASRNRTLDLELELDLELGLELGLDIQLWNGLWKVLSQAIFGKSCDFLGRLHCHIEFEFKDDHAARKRVS